VSGITVERVEHLRKEADLDSILSNDDMFFLVRSFYLKGPSSGDYADRRRNPCRRPISIILYSVPCLD
jgi:hypothetical protein